MSMLQVQLEVELELEVEVEVEVDVESPAYVMGGGTASSRDSRQSA
jgi:hypothetical protein